MEYPLPTRLFVGAVGAAALAAAGAVLAVSGTAVGERWWLAIPFAGILLVGSLNNQRRIVGGGEGQTTTHDESLLVALLFLVPAAPILAALVVEVVVAMVLLRRDPLKAAFNIGKTTLTVSACILVAGPALPLQPDVRGAAAALAGIAVFLLLDHLAMAGVMASLGAARLRDFLADDLGGLALVWSANVAIGLLAGIAATADTWALAVALAAMLPLHFALSGHVKAAAERQRLEEVLGASSEGIVAVDRAGRVRVWNAAMEAVSGIPAADAAGEEVGELLELVDEGGRPLPPIAGVGERRDAALLRADGRRSLELSCGRLPDEGHVLVVHDVTEARRTRAELDERDAELLQAQKMETIGHLTGGIAHDFNNLLTAIGGYGELALASLDAQHPARADVREILTAAERARELTRRLLDHSRRRPAHLSRLDLGEQIEELQSLLRRLVGGSVAIEVVRDGSDLEIETDPTQLAQVALNLVVNARDATPGGGTVTIRTRREGAWALLEVCDTGIGMDPETAARVFDPLFTTKPAGQGTGLGLSTVESIVRGAGGRVAVESELGRGSTFVVSFPLVPSSPAHEPARKEPRVESRG